MLGVAVGLATCLYAAGFTGTVLNAYGVQSDSILNSRSGGGFGGRGGGFGGPGGAPRGDSSWDALYDSAGQLVADGFTVEMAIPFKSLRYPQRTGNRPHQWGFQIGRTIRGKDESVVWAPDERGHSTSRGRSALPAPS